MINFKLDKNNLPISFQIGGHDWTIKYDKTLDHLSSNVGETHFREKSIILQPSTESQPRHFSDLEHSLFHELLHVALNELYETELNNNEKFVETLAGSLYQMFKTMKFKEGDKCIELTK